MDGYLWLVLEKLLAIFDTYRLSQGFNTHQLWIDYSAVICVWNVSTKQRLDLILVYEYIITNTTNTNTLLRSTKQEIADSATKQEIAGRK